MMEEAQPADRVRSRSACDDIRRPRRLVLTLLCLPLLTGALADGANRASSRGRTPDTVDPVQAELREEATSRPYLDQPTALLRILDESGQPVPGARVSNYVRRLAEVRGRPWRSGGQRGVTDDQGTIVLPLENLLTSAGHNASRCQVVAWDMVGERVGLARVDREDAGREIRLTLVATCRLQGTLDAREPDGTMSQIGWATVEAWTQEQRIIEYESTNGQFELFLPAGEFELRVRGEGGVTAERSVTIGRDELQREISIELPAAAEPRRRTSQQPARTTQPAEAETAPSTASQPDEPPSDWQDRFEAVYRLEENEVLRLVTPPYIPERLIHYRERHAHQAGIIDDPPDYFQFRWDDGLRGYGYGFVGGPLQIQRVLGILGLASHEYEVSTGLNSLRFAGDWILREDTSPQQRLEALAEITRTRFGRRVVCERRTVERDVVVVRGSYSFRPLVGIALYDEESLHLFSDRLDPDEGAGGGTSEFPKFVAWLGDLVGRPVIDETDTSADTKVVYANHRSSYLRKLPDGPERDAATDRLLSNLARQSSLRFISQRRRMEVWSINEETEAARPVMPASTADR